MASSNLDLDARFEKWLNEKLKANNNDQEADASLFTNYIISMLAEDEDNDQKRESIKPILQELNQARFFINEQIIHTKIEIS